MTGLRPFRADHVGSLLRTGTLKTAREAALAGRIGLSDLQEIEDREIAALVAKQEAIGLRSVTDGEFRRAYWHFDFLERLPGVTSEDGDSGMNFKGGVGVPKTLRIRDKVGYAPHPMVGHFRYLAAKAKHTPKMTIPGPSMLHYRGGRKMMEPGLYPDMEEFYADVGRAYAGAVADMYGAGCRYLQLDDISFAYLCDPAQREMLRERGDNPDRQPQIYAGMVAAALAQKPADLLITMHLCRGNFRSSWIAQGGYEPIAQILFNEINSDAYFMEYDSDRAGGFEPLRFVPKGKSVVLGLVTSKTGQLESKDELKRRIEAAATYLDLDQLCLSPQCGFASTEEGNLLDEEEQWAKLTRIVEVAREVWGSA